MTIREITNFIELLAPKWTAWERDNTGLQVGDLNQPVESVLLSLDVTEEVVKEAIQKRIDLIISHHPLLFKPAKSITTSDTQGKILFSLIRHQISLYSSHTNLDFCKDGVSFSLAKKLGLEDVQFLSPLKGSLAKIVVFVPVSHNDKIMEAMARAGAGVIGEYSHCSFQIPGKGTFKGGDATNPFIGKPGALESVEEIRLEMISPRANIPKIIDALMAAHPYEEVAYDIYSLENEHPQFGMGAIGNLPKKTSLASFLKHTKRSLGASMLRHSEPIEKEIRRVAVCGGSGSDLLEIARSKHADVFITSDVRYHSFHDAAKEICLVDAGHWETEHVILDVLSARLRDFIRTSGGKATIQLSKKASNPVRVYS